MNIPDTTFEIIWRNHQIPSHEVANLLGNLHKERRPTEPSLVWTGILEAAELSTTHILIGRDTSTEPARVTAMAMMVEVRTGKGKMGLVTDLYLPPNTTDARRFLDALVSRARERGLTRTLCHVGVTDMPLLEGIQASGFRLQESQHVYTLPLNA